MKYRLAEHESYCEHYKHNKIVSGQLRQDRGVLIKENKEEERIILEDNPELLLKCIAFWGASSVFLFVLILFCY
jgi:hypothetical protein